MVQVKLYGSAQVLAGRPEIGLDCPPEGLPLSELLHLIAARPARVPAGIASAILVNGRNCAFLQGMDTRVGDGDRVEILPIVTGG
jgi:molybdopterin converting factor small subunit